MKRRVNFEKRTIERTDEPLWFWLVAARYGVREVALAIRYPQRISRRHRIASSKLERTRELELESVSTRVLAYADEYIIEGKMIKGTKREATSVACHLQTNRLQTNYLPKRPKRRQPLTSVLLHTHYFTHCIRHYVKRYVKH